MATQWRQRPPQAVIANVGELRSMRTVRTHISPVR